LLKRIVSGIMLTLLLISVLTLAFNIQTVKARTIIVPDEYSTIQEAIDAASLGDTVYVKSGTYYEHVTVNKPVSLIGENKSNTVIDGSGTGTVVTLTVDNVTISEFTIQNSGSSSSNRGIYLASSNYVTINNNLVTNNAVGICLSSSDGSIIENVTALDNWAGGISLWSSSNNSVVGNTASDSSRGISLGDHCSNNSVVGNTVAYSYHGIGLDWCSNNVLSGNSALNNRCGISLSSSSNNSVVGNTVSNNDEGGITIEDSSNNVLSGNSALNNGYGISLWSSSNNSVVGNTASDNRYNFAVHGNSFSDFNNYVDKSNTVDGKLIYYLIDAANAVYGAETNAGTVYVINGKNITVRDLTLTKNEDGVFFWNVTNSRIENVTALSNGHGIRLYSSSNNSVVGNTASNNTYGGISLVVNNNNILSGNTALNNREGISLVVNNNNILSGNTASNNEYGIGLSSSSNNSVVGNTVSNNDQGVRPYYSSTNLIYHNNFINNTNQVYSYKSINTWDDGYPSGGNYWSDYEERYPDAEELDNSGIWDTPYVIDENNQDNYPLMEPWTPPPISATININPKTLNLRSQGKWITAYIELPEGYDVGDIDVSSIRMNETFVVDSTAPTQIGDYDGDSISDLMVKFNRTELTSYIYNVLRIELGEVALTVSGQLNDGTPFEGSDTIRALLAGDINKDNIVNVIDLSIVARGYGIMNGEDAYEEEADLNSDGIIDVADLSIVAINLGATIPE
jgi:parallel beta-helix repeat protein